MQGVGEVAGAVEQFEVLAGVAQFEGQLLQPVRYGVFSGFGHVDRVMSGLWERVPP